MMVLITMVVVAGVGLRASLRSLGRSSQRLGGPHLPPEATTLSHTYSYHCSKQRQGWPDHCGSVVVQVVQSRDKAGQTSGSGTSSAE